MVKKMPHFPPWNSPPPGVGVTASRRSPDARGQRARVRAAHLLQGAVLPDHLQGRGGERVLMCNIMYTYK